MHAWLSSNGNTGRIIKFTLRSACLSAPVEKGVNPHECIHSILYMYITRIMHIHSSRFALHSRVPIDLLIAFGLSHWYWGKPCWRHQMETFSALLALCAGTSPVTCEFPAQRPVTCSFGVFFDLRLNKRLSKQWWGWWFETTSRPLWRRCIACDCPSLRRKCHHFEEIFRGL